MPFVRRHRDYYKYGTEPNANIVGSPTINDGVVSGFSSANYLTIPESVPLTTADNWEQVVKFTYVPISDGHQGLIATNNSDGGEDLLGVYSGGFPCFWAGAVSSNTNLFVIRGTTSLVEGNTYWIKAVFTGNEYILYLSETGEFNGEETLEGTYSSTTKLITRVHYIGTTTISGYLYNPKCSIDLNESYIKINGETWWHGTKDYQINVGGDDDYEDWEQPVLSANDSDPSFIVGASSVFSNNYAAWKSFKRITTDKYSWMSDSVDTLGYPQYYTITTDRPLKVSTITMKNGKGSFSTLIGVWQASKDNINWVDIVEFTSPITTPLASWSFEPNETVGYKYHRFKFTDVLGSSYINLGYPTITAKILKKEEDIIADADYYVDRNKFYQLVKPKRFYYNYSNEHNTKIIGNRSIVLDGIASNFKAASYLLLPGTFDIAGGKTWEIVTCFTTGSDITTEGNLVGTNYYRYDPIAISITSSHFVLEVCSGTGTQAFELTGSYTVQPNTKYWLRASFNGSEYIVEYSLDGVDYVVDVTKASAKSAYSQPLIIGGQAATDNGTVKFPWLGSIYLKECYMKIDGEYWWNGATGEYTAVGKWIDEGVASGFSSSQYITVPFLFAEADKPWEAVVKFRTGATLGTAEGTTSVIIGGTGGYKNGISAWINSVGLRVGISSNGSSYNILAKTTIATGFVADTDYWFKAEFTGIAYKLYHSVDGINWSEPYVVENSTPIVHSAYLTMGGGYLEGNVNYGTSVVYLNDCYIKSGDRLWWHGTKVVEGDKDNYAFYEDRLSSYTPILNNKLY